VLILDEATSNVDTRTEVLIQEAMARLRDGPYELRHRPPALDDPRRRHDHRDG
jgi:ABC-type bacteriocin/lantibiotic exporter with double-glycine peptidase domain